jgi:hypothetical protein
MGATIYLDKGPVKRESLGNYFKGKKLPSRVAFLQNISIVCPNAKKQINYQDNQEIFLVPTSK